MPRIEVEFQILEDELTRELVRMRLTASCPVDTRIIEINSASPDGKSYTVAHGCAGGMGHRAPLTQCLRDLFRVVQARSGQLIHFLLGDNVYDNGCQTKEGVDLWDHFVEIYGRRTGAGTVDFPWHRCFGVLGNHDYNLINPFIRMFSFYGRIYGPRIAYNQIIQSYRLLRGIELTSLISLASPAHLLIPPPPPVSATALPAHFLPARYYAVNDSHAFYFCLDTNVLLFDRAQQIWFQQTLDRVQNTPELRQKFLIVICHQPLQTFGKRSEGNGDSDYYFSYLSDPADKEELRRFLHELVPYYVEDSAPEHPSPTEPRRNLPLSILLRRYIEREFSRRHLRIAVVMSAHDHFNECSFISTITLQVIAGASGVTKDAQTDQSDALSFQTSHTISHAAAADCRLSTSSSDARLFSMKWPFEMLLSREHERPRAVHIDRLTVPPPSADERAVFTARESLFPAESPDDQTTLPYLNALIRGQFDVPLLAISAERINISWQTPGAPVLQLCNPAVLSYDLSLNRVVYKDILRNIWFLNDKFTEYARRPIGRKFLVFSLPGTPKHVEEINTRFAILFEHLSTRGCFVRIPGTAAEYLPIIIDIHTALTELIQITSRALGTRSYFRSAEASAFYKGLHFHFLNVWCTCLTFIEFLRSYPAVPTLPASAV